MENKLEQLLNTLIQRGWKPFGKRDKLYAVEDGIYIFGRIASDWNTYDLRQIASRESNLWQFVCENGMIEHKGIDIHSWEHTTAEHSDFWFTDGDNYEYFIIESSLKDESELEDFLLSNIVIKDE